MHNKMLAVNVVSVLERERERERGREGSGRGSLAYHAYHDVG